MSAVLFAVVAQVIVSIVLVVWTRSTVRRFLGSGEELERIRREIGALIVELDSSADRNVTVLEDRLTALKDMIAESDKRLAMLGQDRSRRQAEGAVYDRLGRGVAGQARASAVQASSAPPADAPDLAAGLPADGGYAARLGQEPAPQRPGMREDPAVPFIRFSDKPLPIEEPFADKVLALSRRGFSSDIIAARLGATMAEIDLVLSLESERDGRSKEL